MPTQKHQVQQSNQKQTINTSYGKITVPAKTHRNNSPSKLNSQKVQHGDGFFDSNKNGKFKKQVSKDAKRTQKKQPSLQVDMALTDQRRDQFQPYMELPILWGALMEEIEDPATAIYTKRESRKAKIQKRREKLPGAGAVSILKNNKVDPVISVEMQDEQSPYVKEEQPNSGYGQKEKASNKIQRKQIKQIKQGKPQQQKQRTGKSMPKKQVSIKEDKKTTQAPTPGAGGGSEKKKAKHRMTRGASSDANLNIGAKKMPSYVSGSEFTLSSIGKEDNDNNSNSIISEEDSAFDDCSPAQRKQKTNLKSKEKRGNDFGEAAGKRRGEDDRGLLGIQGNAKNASIQIMTQNPEPHTLGATIVTRQKTTGIKKDTESRSPIQRSPTHKSRNGNQGSDRGFKMQKVGGTQEKARGRKGPTGDGRHSRNSSLNFPSDNQTDQLSVNFGKTRFIGGRKESKGPLSQFETLSVQSIISKGGTVINPLNIKNPTKKSMRSLSRFHETQQNMKESNYSKPGLRDETSRSRFKEPFGEVSRSNMRIAGEELDDDIDVKRSMQKAKKKMMQVYLKTPYKVLTINEIKLKQRENYSPMKLFRAENNLQLHTALRSEQNMSKTTNKPKLADIGDEATQLLKSGAFNLTSNNPKVTESQISIHEERHVSPTYQTPGGDVGVTEPSVYNAVHASSGDLVLNQNQQLSTYKLKQLKQQKIDLENNFKQVFYDQLHTQLEKRIEHVQMHYNLLKKQKDLFSCYGPTHGYTSSTSASGANLIKLASVAESNFNATVELAQLTAAKTNWFSQTNQTFNISEGEHPEEARAARTKRLNPYTPLPKPNEKAKFVSQMAMHDDDGETLRSLLEMSKTMGFSKKQMEKLCRQQKVLEHAEKSLERYQQRTTKVQPKQPTSSGSFAVKESTTRRQRGQELEEVVEGEQQKTQKNISFYNQRKSQQRTKPRKVPPLVQNDLLSAEDAGTLQHPSQATSSIPSPVLSKKRALAGKQTSIKRKDGGNGSEVKDYFSNKISLRRSIEQKLHYDGRNAPKQAAQTTKKTKIGANHSHRSKNLLEQSSIDQTVEIRMNGDLEAFGSLSPPKTKTMGKKVSRTHMKNRTMVEQELTDAGGTLLPQIRTHHTSARNGGPKEAQAELDETQSDAACPEIKAKSGQKSFFFSPEGHYPLKKSGTHNEKTKQPIRQQRDNVIMAFAAKNMFINNKSKAQIYDKKNSHQLGYQYMNKSPRLDKNHYQLTERKGDTSHKIKEDDAYNTLIMAEGGPSNSYFKSGYAPSKFAQSKQSLMLKGVLNSQRRLNKVPGGHNSSTRSKQYNTKTEYNTIELINNYARPSRNTRNSQTVEPEQQITLPEIGQPMNSNLAPAQ